MRYVTSIVLPILLACEGCVSFTYSRFKPEASRTDARAECTDWPPFADLLIGLGLAGAGFAANYFRQPVDGCAFYPQDPNCHSQIGFYIPAMVAGASMAYGTFAYFACESSHPKVSSPGWQLQAVPRNGLREDPDAEKEHRAQPAIHGRDPARDFVPGPPEPSHVYGQGECASLDTAAAR